MNKTKKIIGENNIAEYIEPSAGEGVFLDYLDKTYLAYDIEPEDVRIVKQDYLTLDIHYKKGRCVIGNPPFGRSMSLAKAFFKKSIIIADYISFILPISQYKNTQSLYEFDLIHTEDLGLRYYSDIKLHCAFNIYKRPLNGLHKSPPSYKLKDITVTSYSRGSKKSPLKEYDFGICTWGDGSCGKEIEFPGQYAQEHYIIINNHKYKNEVMRICKNTDWRNLYPSVSSAKLQTWKIYKHFKEQIPELQ